MLTAPEQAPISVIKYNPQLDGLRFFAVLFVVCYHWLPTISENKLSFFFSGFVNFFFVLSSYLITKILFSAKDKSLAAGISKYKVLLVFLLRRTIRIFPAYYVYLVVAMLVPLLGAEVKNNAGMYFGYLANYHMFSLQQWPGITAHLWTLAVEEQFYLVWPLIILFMPHKHLLTSLLTLIIGSVVFRAFSFQPTVVPQAILTQFAIDPFAVGGLLAYKYTLPENKRVVIDQYITALVFVAVPAAIAIIAFKSYYFTFVISGLLFSIISVKIIDVAVLGYSGFTGRFLQHEAIRYVGKISYGIYLYHLLVPILFWKLFSKTYDFMHRHFSSFFVQHQDGIAKFLKIIASEASCFIIYSVSAVLMAILSWNLIEKPINKFKMPFTTPKQAPSVNN